MTAPMSCFVFWRGGGGGGSDWGMIMHGWNNTPPAESSYEKRTEHRRGAERGRQRDDSQLAQIHRSSSRAKNAPNTCSGTKATKQDSSVQDDGIQYPYGPPARNRGIYWSLVRYNIRSTLTDACYELKTCEYKMV